MFQFMDLLGLRLHVEAQQETLRGTMAASRSGTARRRVGGWLMRIGEWLSPETAQELRTAVDCT